MNLGQGVMAVWNDLEFGHEAEFEAWYQRQHIPERLRVPGFREARRYVAASGSPRYCAFYWLDDIAVMASPVYLERLAHPTRWTKRMMPRFRAMGRSPCSVTLDRGAGLGGAMTWIAMLDRRGAPRACIERAFDRAAGDPALVRLQLWECEPRIAALVNPEQQLRTHCDQVAEWIVCIEATTESAVQVHAASIVEAISPDGQQPQLYCAPAYRLVWRLEAAASVAPCSDDEAGIPATAPVGPLG